MSPLEQKRVWNRARWERRRRKHLCQRCGDKLAPRYLGISCKPCREARSLKRASGIRREATERLQQRLAFIAKTYRTHSLVQQAEQLGVKPRTVRWMRWEARRQGFVKVHGNSVRHRESARWRELDASEARCRCGLLLPCWSCLPLHADAYAHRGPGRVYPGTP